jgi:hypothetical protein
MPNRFIPASQNASLEELIRLSNTNFSQIDSESVTKAFTQANGNAIVQGRLPYGGYGQIYYDTDGKARILIGMSPDDGRMGIWMSKPGQDVLTLLGL